MALELERVLQCTAYTARRSRLPLSEVVTVVRTALDCAEVIDTSAVLKEVLSGLGADATKIDEIYRECFNSASLNLTIERWRRKGVDAEAVLWALITNESARHINLVWLFANRLTRTFPDREPDELLAWGWQGLRVALRNYDPARGFAFSTYAAPKITGAIRDGVRAESPVPKRLATFSRKVTAAEEILTHQLGRAPTLAEVAERLESEIETLKILPRLMPTASIEEVQENTDRFGGAPSWLVDDSDPGNIVTDQIQAEAIGRALEKLPSEEAQAVQLLVMEGLNPREARAITGATARQMLARKRRGLSLLRAELAEWAPGSR